MQKLINEKTVEEQYGLKKRRLQKWRSQGGGPAWYKIGRNCRYLAEEVENFISSNRRPSSEVSNSVIKDSK